ncbi:hypothetical protein GIB67_041635 [Kingdonia uniflora]|uniref:Uncharacterized protein n=1 Tax=Kingdonia uniflora TaxID=39325 RepID=A0A7J7MQQ7_9MAGN|nr:hypothetical protein GIB67_041635 [Kingdonia uniflora]
MFSASKATRRHLTSKNFKNIMVDFELEVVNSMVHGTDIPRSDTNNQSAKMKHSTLIGFMALDGDDYAIDNFFSEEARLCDNAEDNKRPYDAWERRRHNKTSHFTDSWRSVPYFEASGKNQDFMAMIGAWNLKEEGSWDFSPLSWSYFTKRDTKDDTSMLSKESCSSTAV